jgi:hypothetical protein
MTGDFAAGTTPAQQRSTNSTTEGRADLPDGDTIALTQEELDASAQVLRAARIRAGWETAIEFADHVHVNRTTYAHHETARRAIRPVIARLYEQNLHLPPGTLVMGKELQAFRSVPIVGSIGERGEVILMHIDNRPPPSILPDPALLQAFVVKGDDMMPAYYDGDTVFTRVLSEQLYDPELIQGCECVVITEAGEHLLRTVTIHDDGLATLTAYRARPIVNVRLIAAAPVELVRRFNPNLAA